ncbi:hypothetical protein LR48_Vigan08g077600 [Vigna angularis]|uniref:Amine oxidase domain-containing protein n=1 Tax=Phaseolus angularis TaxID=3914 RepID=A0A0L9V5L4_PHAAN|nr:hypothetical protein LR48_Vigan08g077600 [Vigna angularis]
MFTGALTRRFGKLNRGIVLEKMVAVRQEGSIDEYIQEFEILVPQVSGKPDHSSLSVSVDLGASVISGVEVAGATKRRSDTSSLIDDKLGLELIVWNNDLPRYDIVIEHKVPTNMDEALEGEYNTLIEDMVLVVAHKSEQDMKMSLEDENVYGGFGGDHCMIRGGYNFVVEYLGQGITIPLNHVVTNVSYGIKEPGQSYKVKVSTANGNEFFGDVVLVTVLLGCLKAETIQFYPPLPEWKCSSVQRLGYGVLNKVALECPSVLWDDAMDYFGATVEERNNRGHCFMFWNVRKTVGAPIFIALVVGKAAIEGQILSSYDKVKHALKALSESSLAKSIYEMLEVNRIQEEWKTLEEDLPPPKPPDLNWRAPPGKRRITSNNNSLTSTLTTRLILRGRVMLGINEGINLIPNNKAGGSEAEWCMRGEAEH